MIIEKDGHMTGSVSGGCVEGEVVAAAKDTIRLGSSQLLNFGVHIENAWAAGLSCGGNITVFICPDQFIQHDIFSRIKTAEMVGRSTTIICDLKKGSIAEFLDSSQVYDSKCKGTRCAGKACFRVGPIFPHFSCSPSTSERNNRRINMES